MSSQPQVDKAQRSPVIPQAPESILSTMDQDGKRRWVYPTPSPGKLRTARGIVAWLLIFLFLGLPLTKIGGKPAIFLDLIHREFTFFGLTLYSTDTVMLMLFALISLLSVFFATALLGRVWCGWGCPQTVYMEFVYRPIERLFEGKENARRKRDQGPMTPDKFVRKFAKFSFYIAISLLLAHTFVAYFVSWEVLLVWMQRPPSDNWGFFLMMALTTALVLFDFAYFREQMCTIACPYARFQSVLMDKDSLIVSYDPTRGEPRGRRSRAQRKDEQAGITLNLGDCIDCGACVRTCPTGIDIRDGLQMECISCTQCIDACDVIMISVNKPTGLIRYTSENLLSGAKARIVRPRTVFYGALLLLLGTIFTLLLTSRTELEVNVGRVVAEPYTTLGTGEIANRLNFRIQNRGKTTSAEIVATAPEGTQVRIVGLPKLELPGGETKRVDTFVIVPPEAFVNGSANGTFEVRTADGYTTAIDFNLLGPSENGANGANAAPAPAEKANADDANADEPGGQASEQTPPTSEVQP